MQQYVHQQIEEHARDHAGRVRVPILKARQQGCSTYIGARFYHRATHRRGQQVFILTHEQSATDNLFDMANRLPIPAGAFNIMLRVYGPKGSVADNTYVPPGILRR